MVLHGRIENGAVVFSEHVLLPEGTQVTVIVQPSDTSISEPPASNKKRIRLPLVNSKQPGTRRLTADRVAELLDEDGLST